MVRVISMAAVVSCFLFGCGGKSPPDLCNEFADAFAATATRCGFDGPKSREGLLQSFGGSCQNIVDIRDDEALEAECIPWFKSVGCDIVQSEDFVSAFPAACKGQLIHK